MNSNTYLRQSGSNKIIPYLQIVIFLLFVGCGNHENLADTFPGDMHVISMYSSDIRILNCQGLGRAQPSGIISKPGPGPAEPRATWRFPRLKTLPREIDIEWVDLENEEKFTQHLQLPSNAKGSIGELLFTLHEDNSWTCELVDPNDWTKKL